MGTFKIFDAAKNISGAGFKFSNASADTIASNLIKAHWKESRPSLLNDENYDYLTI